MTPQQKIKWAILNKDADFLNAPHPEVTEKNVDALYEELEERVNHWDAMEEIRQSGEPTGLECEWSRHYESEAVAAKMPDGSWVGWTFWHGGGKHGEPEAIDWMSDAYGLECSEEERVVVVRTFMRAQP